MSRRWDKPRKTAAVTKFLSMQLTLRALKMGPDHRDKVVTVAPEFCNVSAMFSIMSVCNFDKTPGSGPQASKKNLLNFK